MEAIKAEDLDTISHNLCNVLEEVTIKEYPIIQQIKELLVKHGAKGALMSGSGSAVFGIFDHKETAEAVTTLLKKQDIIRFAYSTTVYNRERESDYGK